MILRQAGLIKPGDTIEISDVQYQVSGKEVVPHSASCVYEPELMNIFLSQGIKVSLYSTDMVKVLVDRS